MKIEINNVIECLNKTLDTERRMNNLPEATGHFVFYLSWEKEIGAVKTFYANISFVNIKDNSVHPVVKINHTISCPISEIDKAKEQVACEALQRLFIILRVASNKNTYDTFLKGDFKGWT